MMLQGEQVYRRVEARPGALNEQLVHVAGWHLTAGAVALAAQEASNSHERRMTLLGPLPCHGRADPRNDLRRTEFLAASIAWPMLHSRPAMHPW